VTVNGETPAGPSDPSRGYPQPDGQTTEPIWEQITITPTGRERQGLGLGMGMPLGIGIPLGIGMPLGIGDPLGVGVSPGIGM
jgi:hypothetical protein